MSLAIKSPGPSASGLALALTSPDAANGSWINTAGKFAATYGTFSATVTAAGDPGVVPAFYPMSPRPGDCSEIDIMEAAGTAREFQTNYFSPVSGCQNYHNNVYQQVPFDISAGLHTYTLKWEPQQLPVALGRQGDPDRDQAAAAAQVGWLSTLATLMEVIRPWRDKFAIVVSAGITRVAAFIGVGIVGALAVAAVKTGGGYGYLLLFLAILAPLAGILHWVELWLAHDIAYRLLVEMRIELFRKLELAGAGLSGAAALGPSDRARRAGHRDGRIFFRAYRGASAGRDIGAGDGAAEPVYCRLADRAGDPALHPLRGAGAGGAAHQDRPARRGRPGSAGAALGLCDRDHPGPLRPRRVPGGRAAARRLYGGGA